MIIATVQGVVRPSYDPWHQAVSALSLGPGGWIQVANFILLGAVILATVPIWRRILAGGRGASGYPRLTALLGVSLIAAGCVPQDPAPGYDPEALALQAPTVLGQLHLAIAAVAALCTVASLLVMASRFAGDRQWRGWTLYSRLMAGLVVFCIAVYGVWSTKASGYAGTFERAALVIPAVWTFTFLRRLRMGTPFMIAAHANESNEKSKPNVVSGLPPD
jgi:hypothetical protein